MDKLKKSDIAREYILRFPDTPSLTLAKKIYAENIAVFKSIEEARSFIRYARGTRGEKNRKVVKSKQLKMFYIKPGSLKKNPFMLPKSEAKKPKIFSLPAQYDNVLVLSDLHIPYHDIEALTIAIKYGKEKKINCILINGDLMDFFMISKFVKLSRRRSVAEELETARQILDILNREFPKVPIYFLKGNHCIRLEIYLAVKAPELLDMNEFRLEYLLDAKKHNMTVLEDTTLIRINRLNITHGHLLIRGIFSPVNSARGAFLKAKAPVLIGHVHKVSTHSETTLSGKTITTYSTGCLCELNPDYFPFGNNYSHGFAHVKVESGMFKVRNIQIVNGEIVH